MSKVYNFFEIFKFGKIYQLNLLLQIYIFTNKIAKEVQHPVGRLVLRKKIYVCNSIQLMATGCSAVCDGCIY